jgi:phosphate transport system substrate-binding protein
VFSYFRLITLATLLLLGATWHGPLHAQQPLKLGGSGAGLGTLKLLAEAFERTGGTPAKITPSLGSSGSIKAVMAGALDLAISSRMPDKSEPEATLVGYAFSSTPVVFAVASASPLKEITLTQAAAIYAKTQLELSPGVIAVPILRYMQETDVTVLMKLSPQMNKAYRLAHERRGMQIAATDTENIQAIEQIPGAIGTTTLAQIKSESRNVKPLVLDGVAPSVQALAKGTYPYKRALHIVTRKQQTPAVQAFIAFIQSAAGRQIIEQNDQIVPNE